MSKAMLHLDGALCPGPGVIVNVCICDSELIAKQPESTGHLDMRVLRQLWCLANQSMFLSSRTVSPAPACPSVHIINRKHLASLFPGTCED